MTYTICCSKQWLVEVSMSVSGVLATVVRGTHLALEREAHACFVDGKA